MSDYTLKLLKCPSCGGPIDPPGGENTVKCPYCGSAVSIPENLRKPDPNQKQPQGSLLNGMDMGQMMGYGAQWSQVVQLAQQGKKEEAVQKYLSFSSISESDARRTVDALASSQVYEFSPGTGYSTAHIAPIMASYADTAKTVTKWSMWFTCGITAFIMVITLVILIPVLIGVFASVWAAFSSF
jgi:rRNA maturation protein Nop10